MSSPEKCHSDEVMWETTLVERGKPCEQVTQTLVGALHDGNELIMGASFYSEIDDYHRLLPPGQYDVRNVAYRGLHNRTKLGFCLVFLF